MIAAVFLAAAITKGTSVVAIVEKIEYRVMTEQLSNGDVIVWNVTTLAIVKPEGSHPTIEATTSGPPFIGSEPLLVGQYITFRMPNESAPSLASLEDLQRWVPEGSIPLDAAKRVFEEARIAAADDGGKLWGRSLYGPLLVVDPKTRDFIRNDLFTGKLPSEIIIANTATNVDGVLTTIIPWTSLQGLSSTQRRRLLMHESWHRIQSDLGFPANSPNNVHLDLVDGRYWLQLELRALAVALRTTGEERTAAIRDAISFRAQRRAHFAAAEPKERELENNEGLAEYTGVALRGTTPEETRLSWSRHLERIDPSTSFVRGFAYETGPAYGLLLDVLTPGWTRTYKANDHLAAVLAKAANVTPAATLREDTYGGAELLAAEEKRGREKREREERYRARLVDGPTLELPMTDAHYGFDPNGVTSLGEDGGAYGALEVTAAWGTISVDDGARITSDFTAIYVAAADRAKLNLNAGWKIVPGKRQGDLRVTRE